MAFADFDMANYGLARAAQRGCFIGLLGWVATGNGFCGPIWRWCPMTVLKT